jgi:uncharacterized membrane protein YfcA
MHFFIAGLVGLVSGLTSGLFGVGGGIVMVPAMMLLMRLDPKVAVATSLVVIVPTALAGSIVNHSFGRIDWRVGLALVPLAIVGGLVGSWFKEQVPSDLLKQGFGGFLVLVGLRLLFVK